MARRMARPCLPRRCRPVLLAGPALCRPLSTAAAGAGAAAGSEPLSCDVTVVGGGVVGAVVAAALASTSATRCVPLPLLLHSLARAADKNCPRPRRSEAPAGGDRGPEAAAGLAAGRRARRPARSPCVRHHSEERRPPQGHRRLAAGKPTPRHPLPHPTPQHSRSAPPCPAAPRARRAAVLSSPEVPRGVQVAEGAAPFVDMQVWDELGGGAVSFGAERTADGVLGYILQDRSERAHSTPPRALAAGRLPLAGCSWLSLSRIIWRPIIL